MKKIFTTLFLFFILLKLNAQIIGADSVCAGSIYIYSVNLPGAVTYHWTVPAGWYYLQGQGDSAITVRCNVKADSICVEGFDSALNSVGVICKTLDWASSGGNSSAGWDIVPSSITGCEWYDNGTPQTFHIKIVPNGTGGSGGGGGLGGGCYASFVDTNIVYALYQGTWPACTFVTVYDTLTQIPLPTAATVYHLYKVDTILGKNPPLAKIISGGGGTGSGGGTVNNTITANYETMYGVTVYKFSPSWTTCVGEPVTFGYWSMYPLNNSSWYIGGMGSSTSNFFTPTSPGNYTVYVDGVNWATGCMHSGILGYYVPACLDTIYGDTTLCAGHTYTYTANIFDAINYTWTFPAGWYNIQGLGTATVTATCNQNAGQICVTSNCQGGAVRSACLTTHFSSGDSINHLKLIPHDFYYCKDDSGIVYVNINHNVPSNSCPSGCGTGTVNANVVNGIYNAAWPNGTLVAATNSSSFTIPYPNSINTFYVYLVDTTLGSSPALAKRIAGGCIKPVIADTLLLHEIVAFTPTITYSYNPVCIGDTITASLSAGYSNLIWTAITGCTFISNPTDSVASIIVDSSPCNYSLVYTDSIGCINNQMVTIPTSPCIHSEVNGDSIVCAGYTYTFNATVTHAASYNWTFPIGWYNIQGQGTAQAMATCNLNQGNICVTGYDSAGVFLASKCKQVVFGLGDFTALSVLPNAFSFCAYGNDKFTATLIKNGTDSSCLNGCGNGIANQNIVSGIYTMPWPLGAFVGIANGVDSVPFPNSSAAYFVYPVDTSLGTNATQAIRIRGGCPAGLSSNIINLTAKPVVKPLLIGTPLVACTNDTVTLFDSKFHVNPHWTAGNNTLVLLPDSNPTQVIVTGVNPTVYYTANDTVNGCSTGIIPFTIGYSNCLAPAISFSSTDSFYCGNKVLNYFDNTLNNPTSWQWSFYGASPSFSVNKNPVGIYYTVPGIYDVQLIACNNYSCDTLLMSGLVQVLPVLSAPVITKSNDTLYCTPAFSYEWHKNNNPGLILSTNSFLVITSQGNYTVTVSDSNGCTATSTIHVTTAGINAIHNATQQIEIKTISQNIFEIEFNDVTSNAITLTLTDITGRELWTEKIDLIANSKSKQVDMRNFSTGTYLLTAKSKSCNLRTKIVVR